MHARAQAPESEATLTASAAEVMELSLQATAVIFANGETTERTVAAARQIGSSRWSSSSAACFGTVFRGRVQTGSNLVIAHAGDGLTFPQPSR